MSELKNETDEELELLPQDRPEPELPSPSGQTLSCPKAKTALWAYLRTMIQALCSRKKQVSAPRQKKSAQAWRDEARARNPYWGSGL